MRKPTRRPILASRPQNKRVLQLSQETVRTLTSDDLLKVVTGCPTTSRTTLQDGGSSLC